MIDVTESGDESRVYPRRVEPIDERRKVRLERMEQYIRERLVICLCSLLFECQVDREEATEALRRHVAMGSFKVAPISPGEPKELIYITTRTDVDRDELCEQLIKVTADIEFSVGVLKEVFPNYRRGVALPSQGDLGQRVRRALGGVVGMLEELRLVPTYWRTIHFNSTAIVLTLSYVLGERSAVVQFLRLGESLEGGFLPAAKHAREGVADAAARISRLGDDLAVANREVEDALRRLADTKVTLS